MKSDRRCGVCAILENMIGLHSRALLSLVEEKIYYTTRICFADLIDYYKLLDIIFAQDKTGRRKVAHYLRHALLEARSLTWEDYQFVYDCLLPLCKREMESRTTEQDCTELLRDFWAEKAESHEELSEEEGKYVAALVKRLQKRSRAICLDHGDPQVCPDIDTESYGVDKKSSFLGEEPAKKKPKRVSFAANVEERQFIREMAEIQLPRYNDWNLPTTPSVKEGLVKRTFRSIFGKRLW